jgi:tRNA(Arg) A34 adenosine deaminase TadA
MINTRGASRMNLSASDLAHLRHAIHLAHAARANGNRPFGAVLVDARGRLAEGVNTEHTTGDPTAHAELNLLRDVSRRDGLERLAGATVYASAEPCPMCAGALFWTGVARVVYALGSDRLYAMEGESDEQLPLAARIVLGAGRRPVLVDGPAIEDEAVAPFEGFWDRGGTS